MRIPKRIKIGGLQYRVKLVKKISNRGESGETDSGKLVISLQSDAKKEALEVTFLHEILHAININLDEKEVEYLAMALYQVMRDNQQLFKNGK